MQHSECRSLRQLIENLFLRQTLTHLRLSPATVEKANISHWFNHRFGVVTVKLEVIKADSTTEEIFLKDVLHCLDFATNVFSQAPVKRAGVYNHSAKDTLFTRHDEELADVRCGSTGQT